MLSYMRRNAGSWIIKAMLVGIALSFVIGFGILPTIQDSREDQGYVVAQVGERRISRGEWDAASDNLLRYYQQIYSDQLTEDMVKQLRLRETALDSLISRALERQEAERLHLEVSDRELQEKIRSMPYFQRNGTFDREGYLRVLQMNRTTPEAFENQVREEMLLEKLQQIVRGTVKVSELELWNQYLMEREKVNLQFIYFDPKELENKVRMEEGALRQYYEQNGDSFRTPEKVKMAFARFPEQAYREQVEVHTGDLEDYYEDHLDEFSHPEEVHLRHILVRVHSNADEAAVQEKRKFLEGLLARVRKGEDFARLAKTYSEDSSAIREGDLGYVNRGELAPQIESAAFALKAGEVSGIVTSPFGLHLLKVEDYRAAKEDPLEEVKDKVRDIVVREKAWHLARRKAEEFLWVARESKSLQSGLPAENTVAVQETEFLSLNDPIPSVGMENAVLQAAFALQKGEISEAVKGKDAYYVLQAVDRKPSEIPPFEQVRDRVEAEYRVARSLDLAKEKAEQDLERIRKGEPLEKIAEEQGIKIQETGLFSRVQPVIPKIGRSPELAEESFSLTDAQPLPGRTHEVNGKVFLFRLKERVVPSREALLAEKEDVLSALKERKSVEMYREWLSTLRQQQSVKVFDL
ncbi:MAG: SurA N-terminal domain-containing protein [bacterium]